MRISRRRFVAGSAAAAATSAGAVPASTARALTGRNFSGETLREIAFPLGGIGTGTVSLGGRGDLRDWEIFNRPGKGALLPFTFVALRAAGGGMRSALTRVVERRPFPPYSGAHGVPRETGLGLPHVQEVTFSGAYPFANLRFHDTRWPLEVSLEAFNPMEPLETDLSSLPVAVLTYRVVSRAKSPIDAALAFSIMNPVGYDGTGKMRDRRAPFLGRNLNEYRAADGCRGLLMTSSKYTPDAVRYGSMALVTSAAETSYRLEWDHGPWWDALQKWWDEFHGKGRFPSEPSKPSEDGITEHATLAAHFTLEPGAAQEVTWVLAWHFPNTGNYWTDEADQKGKPLPNQYGTRWRSAWEPAAQTFAGLPGLRERSLRYRDAVWNSTLPAPVLDAVSSQASIIRTQTVMVLEGRKTLAFEGCDDNSGCCPMNCTHVYNYEQAMAHLYPDLERSVREIDFLTNMRPDGSMSFRTPVPLRQGGNKVHPAADGQMGCVMKVYREWRLGAGDAWLRKLWPEVKRALEYAWVSWDPNRDGVMEGEQHNTYDIEFYGPNTMMGTLYLGALAAASRMADYLGERETAKVYREIVERGAARLDKELFNGEYYIQKVDDSQPKASRYQYGTGCLSDQLLGQWFAEVVDLGKLLPHAHVQSALDAVFRHNFRQDFGNMPNAQRLYAMNDERGLLLCSWPRGQRPALPFVYSDEVWTGIEYQVAAHLIYEDRVTEGLAVVQAVRERYDGARRNPWNEVECGHHYARAMSSWSLLTALSGFAWSAPHGDLRFRPRVKADAFRCMYSTGTAWGSYSQHVAANRLEAEISVEGGRLELATVRLPLAKATRVVSPSGAKVRTVNGEAVVQLASRAALGKGEKLAIALE